MPKRKKLSASERVLRRDELAVLVAADYDDLTPRVADCPLSAVAARHARPHRRRWRHGVGHPRAVRT